MGRHRGWNLILLAVSTICSAQGYIGRLDPIPNAPFTANVHSVSTKNGEITFEGVSQVARYANGSVYQAQLYGEGEFKGKLDWVLLDDATNGCRISIHPFLSNMKANHAGVMLGTSTGLAFGLSMSGATRFKNRTPENEREIERQSQRFFTAHPISSDGDFHRMSLGERNSNGVTLFGFRNEPTPNSGSDSMSEWWDSDRGFEFSRTNINHSEGTTHSVNYDRFAIDRARS